MKIAVYAIAKNEEKHVSRWIDSIINGADKIIVVDTGSTDKTLDLLEHYKKMFPDKIEVYKYFTLDFRFDTARNEALRRVPEDIDVCVSLDLDEVPSPHFFKAIRQFWDKSTTRAWVQWDTGNTWWNNNRVHSRHGYKWKYPCHEIIVPEIEESFIRLSATVKHIPDDTKPRTSYLKLLRQGFREMSDDSRMYTYFMRELMYHKMWDEIAGISHRVESFEDYWDVEKAQTYRIIGDAYYNLGNLDKSEEAYIKGTQVLPYELEPWLSLAFFYYNTKQWAKCAGAADKVNYLVPKNHYISKESSVPTMYDLLSNSYWNMGILGESYKHARNAHNFDKDNVRLYNNYTFLKKKMEKEYGL